MKRKDIQKKEEKEKSESKKRRNWHERTSSGTSTHLSSSSAAHIPCPHNTASSLDALHKKMGLSPVRSYVRLANTNGLSGVWGSLPADWTDRHHCTRTDLFSVPPSRSLILSVSLWSLSPPPYLTPHRPPIHDIAYDMLPPESLHRTKYQIKAKKNQDLEHTELEMLITMNEHIPLPNPNPNSNPNPNLDKITECAHPTS